MRIAFLVVKNIACGGGIEKYTLELGSRLVKRGHEVTVYSMRHYGDVQDNHHGMRIISVPCLHVKTLEKGSAALAALYKSVISRKFDILHFHTIPAGTWVGLARFFGKKCVLQWHGLEWKRSRFGSLGSKTALFLERMVMKLNISFTAVSKTQCNYFREHYAKDVKYIPTGASVKCQAEPREIFKLGLEPQKYILFASRLVREKGIQYLLPAFRRIDTPFKLVIAGDVPGETKFKEELLQLANNDKRILFPGFVQGRLLDELFSHALVYTQPSDIEGLSIALLEAMSYGCPCLVSDIPENLEAIGDVGWHFRSANIDSLNKQLSWMLNNPDALAIIKRKGKERIREKYSWDKIAESFEVLYQEVLDGHC